MKNKKLIWVVMGLCIIVGIVIVVMLVENSDKDTNKKDIPLPKVDTDEKDINPLDIGFAYCVYFDDVEYFKFIVEKSENLKYLDMEDVVERYFKLANITDTTFETIKVHEIKTKENLTQDVFISPYKTYNICLKGEKLDDKQMRGLINTFLSYTSNIEGEEYVKVFINDEEIIMPKQHPEYGNSFQQMIVGSINWNYKKDKANFEKNVGENVEVTFFVKDENGNPIKNIVYHIEGSDIEENITNNTGEIKFSVKTNNSYKLRLQKKNNIVNGMYGTKATVYDEMLIEFDVKEEFVQEIVWTDTSVVKLNEPSESMLIDISNVKQGTYEDYLIDVNKSGASYTLGYCESDGTIVWNDFGNVSSRCIVTVALGNEYTFYKAEVVNGELKIIEETEEEPLIAE